MATRDLRRARSLRPSAGRPAARLAIVIPAGAFLLIGLDAGLLLMGVPVPLSFSRLPDLHAPLMVFGFVGTLISLERAVALRATWPFAAPLALAAGAILTLTPAPVIAGQALVTAGMAVHVAQYRAIWGRQPMTATAVQALGAVTGTIAAFVWSGGVPPARLVPLLAAFLVLTIVGERLELARVASPGIVAERMLFALATALAVAAVVSLSVASVAIPIAGLLLIGIAAWLLRFDIVRITVRRTGQPRFIAVCLLIGYGWLLVAGAAWLLGGARTDGVVFDAATHAIFLGFVITLIMAHAALILPAVLQVGIPYHPAMYAPVALLQLSLLVRVVAGDAWGWVPALRAGGIGATAAILLFAAIVVTLSARAGRARARSDARARARSDADARARRAADDRPPHRAADAASEPAAREEASR